MLETHWFMQEEHFGTSILIIAGIHFVVGCVFLYMGHDLETNHKMLAKAIEKDS